MIWQQRFCWQCTKNSSWKSCYFYTNSISELVLFHFHLSKDVDPFRVFFLTQVSELQLECRMSYTIIRHGFNTYDLHLCNFIWFSTFTLTRQSTPKLYKLLSQSAIESYWSIEHGGFCYYFLCMWGLFFVESINYT